jgi:glycosyltransferase involved in cell wall biosynthesis
MNSWESYPPSEIDCLPSVLLVGPGLARGGAERRFWYLSEYLFGGIADVLSLLPIDGPNLTQGGRRIGTLGWKSEFSYLQMLLALRKQIKSNKYHIILGIGYLSNLLIWMAALGLRKKTRLLMCEIVTPKSNFASMQHRPQSRLALRLLRRAYRHADAIAANSIDGAEECIAFLGSPRHKTVRVPNIIDPQMVANLAKEDVSLPWPNNKFTVVVSGRLVAQKRVDTVIRSIAELDPALDVALVILGDGPLRSELEGLAEEKGIRDRIHFYGWVANPLPLVAQADVFVLSSDFEGFSNSIIESMYLNVPVIASLHSSDIYNMCEKGAAVGFAPDDVAGLAAALSTVLLSSKCRTEIISNASSYRMVHDISVSIPLYEELILAVVRGGNLPKKLMEFNLQNVDLQHTRSYADS